MAAPCAPPRLSRVAQKRSHLPRACHGGAGCARHGPHHGPPDRHGSAMASLRCSRKPHHHSLTAPPHPPPHAQPRHQPIAPSVGLGCAARKRCVLCVCTPVDAFGCGRSGAWRLQRAHSLTTPECMCRPHLLESPAARLCEPESCPQATEAESAIDEEGTVPQPVDQHWREETHLRRGKHEHGRCIHARGGNDPAVTRRSGKARHNAYGGGTTAPRGARGVGRKGEIGRASCRERV